MHCQEKTLYRRTCRVIGRAAVKSIEDEVIGILVIPACSILLVSRRRSV
jgi:hypothetical protein